jgi:hypothetical protein
MIEPHSVEAVELQDDLAAKVETAFRRATNESDRSRQSNTNVLGVSDIGNCHEYVRRMIVNEEPSQDVDRYDLAAFIGTAIGDHIEAAMVAMFPGDGWVKQAEVTVQLHVRGFELNIPGHPDLHNRRHLIDFKSRDGLAVVRRTGPSDQERFQKALYAKALIERGDMDRKDCWLHNVYIDRSAVTSTPVVFSEPYDEAIVAQAIEWLDDVLYAVQMDEFAMRDPAREWCWACCPFAPQCRGEQDSDVSGLIDDPVYLEAIDVYLTSSEQIKALEKDRKSASSALRGAEGRTETHSVRWIEVGASEVPATTRSAYSRLDIRPIRTRASRRRKVEGDG